MPESTKETWIGNQIAHLRRNLEWAGIDPQGWRIERWSPGDGWTRYKVVNDKGRDISHNLHRNELEEFISGMVAMLNELDAHGLIRDRAGTT